MCDAPAGRTLGVIFWQLTRAARRIGQREGPHYAAVQAARTFYDEWLQPKLDAYFEVQHGAGAGGKATAAG